MTMFENQKAEAIKRMRMLRLHPNTIKEFDEEGKVNLSELGILYWLNESEQEMVKEWEKQNEAVVYHVIKNNMDFGMCYSFLYVSKYPEEWEMDNADLKDFAPIVYVKNVDDDFCSEFGRICILPRFGGVLRTA